MNIRQPESGFPGMRFVVIHSFAHALMRAISLDCGYSAASLRERLYVKEPQAGQSPMAGILIYTSAADVEGTLGGLVALGRNGILEAYIQKALRDIRICASDPLCSEHDPVADSTCHLACCHSCLFAPETSCECGNKYLDRATLVETVFNSLGEKTRPLFRDE